MDDSKIVVAIIAIAVSSVFSAIGLFRGYFEQKRANRIAIAKRLSEVSFIFSEHLPIIIRIKKECELEIKKIKTAQPPDAHDRIEALNKVLMKSKKEHVELDNKQESISEMFKKLDKVKPENIEIILKNEYSWKEANNATLEFLLSLKKQ